MPHADVNGLRWYYELNGPQEAPVVVLANGILADTYSWGAQERIFSKRYRVLVFDFPGQGRSDRLKAAVTVSEQAAGASILLSALKLDPVHWIGVSYGGEVGLQLALAFPGQLRSLIIADSVASVDANLEGQVQAWLIAAKTGDHELLCAVSMPDIFSPAFIMTHPKVIAVSRQGYKQLDLASVVYLLAEYHSYDVSEQLGRIRLPTLLLCGELDTLKPPSTMQAMADRLLDAEFITVPRAGHALPLERPAEFLTACLGFLSKQEVQ